MVKSISIIISSVRYTCVYDENQKHKLVLDIAKINLADTNSFDIEIVFNQPVLEFRNHDYTWVRCDEDRVANEFCPKILKLQNGQSVQANINKGIWEINKRNSHILLWRFNPEFSEPITNYVDSTNKKEIVAAKKQFHFPENPALLFPVHCGIEFSRSKYPFSAIACFTDHCDFDTAENLVRQREFFNEKKVKITKGFFLNHFSKRTDNASFQNDKEELLAWRNDEHELCYHSLSQSIKNENESFEDFENFVPPFNDLKVWIDHGFQPYNFSLLKNNVVSEEEFSKILKDKNISTLWNYIDSGTSTSGVINQLNAQHFTLASFLQGNRDLGSIKKIQLMIKNIIFHYYNDENMILKYKYTAGNFKKIVFQKKIKFILPFLKNILALGMSIVKVIFSWKKAKNRPYKLAKYSPIVFKNIIGDKEFYVFQTLEMLDFKKSLSKQNIDTLVNEKGLFIAHTYFSVPLEYHSGKLFSDPETIDSEVSENFSYLGNRIKNKEIWNPTLTELIEYWASFENVIFDIDLDGNVFEKNTSDIIFRKIS